MVKGIIDSGINIFFVFSIVIDYDGGQALKKMKIEPVTCIWMFVCVFVCVFALVVWGIRIQPTFALVRVVKGD